MGLLPKAAIVVVVLGIIGAVGGSGSNSDKTETVAESSAVETAAETEALAENVVEDSSAEEATANVPKEYISALKSSETYSSMMHMSKQAIYDQLVSEYGGQFTPEAAQYAIDNIQADWNANALASAETYSSTMHMSKRLFMIS